MGIPWRDLLNRTTTWRTYPTCMHTLSGEPQDRHVVIVDDLVQTGGTLIQCAKVRWSLLPSMLLSVLCIIHVPIKMESPAFGGITEYVVQIHVATVWQGRICTRLSMSCQLCFLHWSCETKCGTESLDMRLKASSTNRKNQQLILSSPPPRPWELTVLPPSVFM